MLKQVVIIHGGDTFLSYEEYFADLKNCPVMLETFLPKTDWKSDLAQNLGADYQVLQPRMPNKQNAQYQEWKVWLERLLPFLKGEVILVGHSLGALFLIKYLSENQFNLTISKLILLAGPFDFPEIDTWRFGSLELITKQCQNIVIMHSEDDLVVPVADARAYTNALPGTRLMIFKDFGHFNQADFPELVEEIQK